MLNFLIGERRLRNIRDLGRQFAGQAYDPSTMAPQRQAAERQASQGIDTGAVRGSALSQLGRIQPDTDIFGGHAGRGVGMMGQQNLGMARGLVDMETQLGLADQQARMQGRQATADIQGRQAQIGAQREAAMTEADMMYEAEVSSRRQALGGTAVTLGTLAGMGAFPGLKGGALKLVNLLSGNEDGEGLEGVAESAISEVTSRGQAEMIRNLNPSRQDRDITAREIPQTLDDMSFGDAFGFARSRGMSQFVRGGREFHTRTAEEMARAAQPAPQAQATAPEMQSQPMTPSMTQVPETYEPQFDMDIDVNFPDPMSVQQDIGFQPSSLEVARNPIRAWTNAPETVGRRGGSFMLAPDNASWDAAQTAGLNRLNPESPMGQLAQNPEFMQGRQVVDAIRTFTPEDVLTMRPELLDAIRREPAFLRSMNRQARDILLQSYPDLNELYQSIRLF